MSDSFHDLNAFLEKLSAPIRFHISNDLFFEFILAIRLRFNYINLFTFFICFNKSEAPLAATLAKPPIPNASIAVCKLFTEPLMRPPAPTANEPIKAPAPKGVF